MDKIRQSIIVKRIMRENCNRKKARLSTFTLTGIATLYLQNKSTTDLHVVGVEERVDGGVEMAQDDGDIHDERRHSAAVTEGLHAVNGVKREPTEHEEQHDDAQAFGGFDLPPVGVAHLSRETVVRDPSARERHQAVYTRYAVCGWLSMPSNH